VVRPACLPKANRYTAFTLLTYVNAPVFGTEGSSAGDSDISENKGTFLSETLSQTLNLENVAEMSTVASVVNLVRPKLVDRLSH